MTLLVWFWLLSCLDCVTPWAPFPNRGWWSSLTTLGPDFHQWYKHKRFFQLLCSCLCCKYNLTFMSEYYWLFKLLGEQHGFRQAKNIKFSLDGEFYFYSCVFDFDAPGIDVDVSRLTVVRLQGNNIAVRHTFCKCVHFEVHICTIKVSMRQFVGCVHSAVYCSIVFSVKFSERCALPPKSDFVTSDSIWMLMNTVFIHRSRRFYDCFNVFC